MEDQDQDSEIQEVAPPELDQNESQQDDSNIQNAQEAQKADEQEKNWRAMRQRQKEMEYELKQKNEMLDRFLQMQHQPQAPQPAVQEDIIDPDDFANYGGVEKVTRKTVAPLEQKIQALEARLAKEESNKRFSSLRSQYSDFDDVVNVETLEILEKTEPDLAATIAELKDPYKMGIQSYKFIKALNIAEKVPKSRRSKEIGEKIERNEKTLQSPASFDKRPMAQAFKISKAEEKRLYEEMITCARQANGF